MYTSRQLFSLAPMFLNCTDSNTSKTQEKHHTLQRKKHLHIRTSFPILSSLACLSLSLCHFSFLFFSFLLTKLLLSISIHIFLNSKQAKLMGPFFGAIFSQRSNQRWRGHLVYLLFHF